jgi:cytoskeletal protein CcmA (bactofilin family)
MAAEVKPRDFSINTIIGPDTSVYGDLETGGFTRVDGSMRGDLVSRGRIIVGERARMRSNISGTFVTIGGVVYGNVLASESLVILSTGLVLGDIITTRIKAEEGCLIHGRVTVCRGTEAWEQAVADYRDRASVSGLIAKAAGVGAAGAGGFGAGGGGG